MSLSQEEKDQLDPQGATNRQAVENATLVADELTDLNPNVEMDAKEFGEHVRNGGWRLGLLVARNVADDHGAKPWEDEGVSRMTWYRRQQNVTDANNLAIVTKISSRAFARQAGNISDPTVNKYLKAWNLAAVDGHVPSSANLAPGQEVDFSKTDADGELILTPKLWDFYFKPPAGDNEKTVDGVIIKPIERMANITLRDWICPEQYDGTDNSLDDANEAFDTLIRIGMEGKAICSEVARALEMTIKSKKN